MVYDGYVKYEEAGIHRSAIMQDFRKSRKKEPTGSHVGFFSVKFVMGYPCVRHYILFYIHGPVILHFMTQVNVTKFKMAAKRPFCNCLIPKVNQVIG